MSKKINTPFSKLLKKEELILRIVTIIGVVGYGLTVFKFPESKDTIKSIFITTAVILGGIYFCIRCITIVKEPEPDLLDDLDEMLENYFCDIDAEKKKYKGLWANVENWKKKINGRADEIRKLFKQEGETDSVLEIFDKLEEDLNNGLMVIQDGNNPLTVQKGIGHREDEEATKTSKFFSGPFWIAILTALYFCLSILCYGIIFLTIIFSLFLLWKMYSEKLYNIKKATIDGLILVICGYFLNRWTYAQSEEIQLAVTIGLPILYGIIYYKLNHKKQVREI